MVEALFGAATVSMPARGSVGQSISSRQKRQASLLIGSKVPSIVAIAAIVPIKGSSPPSRSAPGPVARRGAARASRSSSAVGRRAALIFNHVAQRIRNHVRIERPVRMQRQAIGQESRRRARLPSPMQN